MVAEASAGAAHVIPEGLGLARPRADRRPRGREACADDARMGSFGLALGLRLILQAAACIAGVDPARIPLVRGEWRKALRHDGGVRMTETMGIVRETLAELDARLDHWKQTLVELCRIPSVSASGFPLEEVRRSAQAVAQTLRDAGVEHVELLEIPGVHPYVYGDWLHRRGRAHRACLRASRRHAVPAAPAGV